MGSEGWLPGLGRVTKVSFCQVRLSLVMSSDIVFALLPWGLRSSEPHSGRSLSPQPPVPGLELIHT